MAAEYTVLKIDEMYRPAEIGGVERYYRHTILTKGKTRLTIDIPEAIFTAEKTGPILLKKAIEADKIKAL